MAEADRASYYSVADSDIGTAILTPQDLPDTLKRQLVLRPEFTLNIYSGPSSGLDAGCRTPTVMPRQTVPESSAVSDLSAVVKELIKKVNDQQEMIAALNRLAVEQQSKITTLETRAKQPQQPMQLVDCGTWAKQDGLWKRPDHEIYIRFAKRFDVPPKVTLALHLADVGREKNLRLALYATDVDTKGFYLHADMWHDTEIYGCGVTWFAVGTAALD